MASAQRRSGTRGRPPPKRCLFTRTGSRGSSTVHKASEIRNPIVVRLFGVRTRERVIGGVVLMLISIPGVVTLRMPTSIPGYSDRLLETSQLEDSILAT